MKNKISKAAAAMGSAKSEKKSKAAKQNGKSGGRPKINIEVGDKIRVALKSSGATILTIQHVGFTAEVNAPELKKTGLIWDNATEVGGIPVNFSQRVPAAIGVDSNGKSYAVYFWYHRWLGAWHRTIQFSREWETTDGQELSEEMAAIADAALANEG
jgi:hypothetical protein